MKNLITGQNYVAGEFKANGSHEFNSYNARTHEKAAYKFKEAIPEEINEAVENANSAFKIVRNYSDEKIASFLEIIAEEIMNMGEILIKIADWETALGSTRLIGERTRTCNQIRMFANYIQKGDYKEIIIDSSQEKDIDPIKPDIRRLLIPLGPVGVFEASNFPFAFGVIGGDTVSAWAARCPVVVKAHPLHPQTSELFAHVVHNAIKRTNFPKGFFSLLNGVNNFVGEQLVNHPLIKAIGFTGSNKGGRAIFNIAKNRPIPIPVYAEMSSVNPIFLMPSIYEKSDVELVNLAETLVSSVLLGVGQFCTKPGLIFIPSHSKFDNFISQFKNILQLKETNPLLHHSIHTNLSKNIAILHDLTQQTPIVGGHSLNKPNTFENTLYHITINQFLDNPQFQHEFFGPITIIIEYKEFNELPRIAENLEGQLTASIFYNHSNSDEEFSKIKNLSEILQYKVGRLIHNAVPTGVEVCYAMNHGGPYPATTDVRTTSVGMMAIKRFLRPIAYQNIEQSYLPSELHDNYSKKSWRMINGEFQKK